MAIHVTPTDIKQGKILKPGWYDCTIKSNREEANKAGDATNLVLEFVVTGGPFEGVPLRIWISEKAPAILGVPLCKALGRTVNEEEGFSLDFPEDSLAGRKIKVKVETGDYKGKPTNSVTDLGPAA